MVLSSNKQKQGKVDVMTLIVFVCLFLVLLVYNNLFSTMDCWLQDFWQQSRIILNKSDNKLIKSILPVKSVNPDVVLIIIDDTSLIGIHGLLANDRRLYAQALKNLKELNPKTIGLDVFFANSDEHTRYQDKELVKAVSELKDKIVIKSYRRDDTRMTPPFPELLRYAAPAPSYFKNYRDKTTRSVSLIFRSESGIYPSFQTWLWAKFKDINIKNDLSFKDGYLTVKDQKLVKLLNSEYLMLNYDRPLDRFRKFSFMQLYNNEIPASEIEGKLVIIGSANSLEQEKYCTPIKGDQHSPVMNGLTLSNILEKTYLTPNNTYITITVTLILLIILYFVLSTVSPVISLIITVVLDIVLLIISLVGLMQYNTQIDVVSPMMATTLSFIFMIGRRYYIEFSEKKHIKSAFQHYVTASVVNEILKDPSKLNLHGEERNLTIFFSDIEGFTSLAEGMSPLDVVSLLNEYLTEMTDIIFEYNGLLDKYEGDAIMAVFGAPVDQSDHATRACQCALKNQKALKVLRDKWHREGKPEMRVRIGINTGLVVVGNMGSTMRFDYTVIGDNVNLAARLEAANKIFNSSILVSEETAKLAEKAVISRKLAKLKAIGKSVYTNIYEILADKDKDSASEIEEAYKAKEAYESADDCLMKRDFVGAEKILGLYLLEHKDDQPAKLLYNKVKGFLLVPPPADWENIVKQEEK